jgi:hypothetical protein
MLITLVRKSARNSTEFRNYSDSGQFSHQNFDQNFGFPIIKHVPTNLDMLRLFQNTFLPSTLPLSSTRKKFPHFLFCPLKLHVLVFQVKRVHVILAGKDITSVFSEILPDASVKTMPLHFG